METGHLCELLQDCLRRPSGDAWEEWIARVQPAVAAAAARILSRTSAFRADAVDDVVQQTFMRLLGDGCRRLRAFEGNTDAQLLAFLRKVATNIALDSLRQAPPPGGELDPDLPAPSADPHSSLILREIREFLRHCAQRNPQRDETVFWRYYRDGLSAPAIAAIPEYNLTTKGVESLILRLTRCLRQAMLAPGEGKRPDAPSTGKGHGV